MSKKPYIHKLSKEQKILLSVLEEDHKVYISEYDGSVEIEDWTDVGEDMIINLETFSLEALEEYARNYDDEEIAEHVRLMMGDKGYNAAVGGDIQTAINDQREWISALRETINKARAALGLEKATKNFRFEFSGTLTVEAADIDEARRIFEALHIDAWYAAGKAHVTYDKLSRAWDDETGKDITHQFK